MIERKYWVVSPNVYPDANELYSWTSFISVNGYAFIGWDDDSSLGDRFKNEIRKNDVIINVHRLNWEHTVYGAGIVVEDRSECIQLPCTPSGAFNRKLFPYIPKNKIDKLNLSELFNTGEGAFGHAARKPALYQLHPESNPVDKKIIEKIENELKKIIEEQDMDEIITLLKAKKNLVLTGAPGTGKTFLAKELARKLLFGKSNESHLSEEEKDTFRHRCGFVQFHPSYDYTDFVEGLRPTKSDNNENIGFKLTDGIFKDFCKKALASPNDNFVFIIDEINRGEISKIFGELFFSIDPDYRGEKGRVITQYQNMITDKIDQFFDGFYIPENIYIIGTMNDIDRSVESFDFAMRRRFTWIEISASESAENMKLSQECTKRMIALNDAISETDGLSSAFHIGGAYFLNKKDDLGNSIEPDYNELWKLWLKPLLKEYLRGFDRAEEKLKELEKAYGLENNG